MEALFHTTTSSTTSRLLGKTCNIVLQQVGASAGKLPFRLLLEGNQVQF